MLRFFRDTCATLPDEMMMVAGLLTRLTARAPSLPPCSAAHCGPLARGRSRGEADQSLRIAGHGRDRARFRTAAQNGLLDAVVAEGRAQLLEVAVPDRPERRRDRHARRRLRRVSLADEPDRHRALPRRRQPRSRPRHRLRDAHHRLQRGHHLAVDGPERQRRMHRLVPRDVHGARPVSWNARAT